MSQEQKSIADFDETLSDALSLCSQVKQIIEIAASVSEKIEIQSQQYYDTSLSLAAYTIAGNYKKRRLVPSVKTGLILSLAIAGWGLVSSWFAKREQENKHKEALLKILRKKQEIASEKLPFIENVLPLLNARLEKISTEFFRRLKLKVNCEALSQKNEQEFVQNLWQIFFEMSLSISACKYLTQEFQAWLNNQQESNETVPNGHDMKVIALSKLMQESNYPRTLNEENILNNFTQGTVLLIHKRNEFKEMQQYSKITDLAYFTASSYAWCQLFFIFKSSKMLRFFKNAFSEEPWINSMAGLYLITYYFYAVVIAYYLGIAIGTIL